MNNREYLMAAATVELIFDVLRWVPLDEVLSRVRQEKLAAPAVDADLLARHGKRLAALETKLLALKAARNQYWPQGAG